MIVLDAGTDLVAGEPRQLTRSYWLEDSVHITVERTGRVDVSGLSDLELGGGAVEALDDSTTSRHTTVRVVLDDPLRCPTSLLPYNVRRDSPRSSPTNQRSRSCTSPFGRRQGTSMREPHGGTPSRSGHSDEFVQLESDPNRRSH